MRRAFLLIVAALALALPAAAQTPPTPSGPPTAPSLAPISPTSAYPGFLDVTFGQQYTLNGVTWGRYWLVNVFPDQMATDTPDQKADASWTMYESECGGSNTLPVVSYWVDATGRILVTVPGNREKMLGQNPGTPLGIGAARACRGEHPAGQRYSSLREILAVVRGTGIGYPEATRTEFLTDCTGEGAPRNVCECVLRNVEKTYTLAQYSDWDKALRAGREHAMSEPVTELARVCVANPDT